MARAVEDALQNRNHLVVEAGTGVGKSLAYLIPLIKHSIETGARILVSTHTINLQEQLIEKDIPLASKLFDKDLRVVLAKGRGNYLCLRRLTMTMQRTDGLFSTKKDVDALWAIADWSKDTADGSLADFHGFPSMEVWWQVSSDQYHCSGSSCAFFHRCFYMKARKSLATADLIVTNHALFVTHLKLVEEGSPFFPEIGAAVLDEAHSLEDVASEHLGLNVTKAGLERILNGLFNEKTKRGILAAAGLAGAEKAVSGARSKLDEFFDEVERWHDSHDEDRRLAGTNFNGGEISSAFSGLAAVIAGAVPQFKGSDVEADIEGYGRRATDAAAAIGVFSTTDRDPGHVYWVEKDGRGNCALRGAPVRVGPILKNLLWNDIKPVVLTSATLAVGKDKSFKFIRDRLGLDEAGELLLGSTFDFKRQVSLCIEQDMPDPREAAYIPALADMIRKYVLLSKGSAFVLFTSYRHLDETYEILRDFLNENNFPSFKQGGELSRSRMLDNFRETPGSVLFGTASFWQGVDVPGIALTNVIITRLPFSVPTTPLALARKEDIEDRGGNYFMEYAIPEAALRFKQGFGRLIRRKDDAGMVVVLDSRIMTQRYGRIFLESIPECNLQIVKSGGGDETEPPKRPRKNRRSI
jgi:ATP-dependent DNA helicase DinG